MNGQFWLHRLTGIVLPLLLHTQLSGQSLSLSVDPPRLELKLKAGEEATESVVIRNGGGASVLIRAAVEPFGIAKDGSVESGKALAGPHDASPWVRVNPSSLTLDPASSEAIRITVRAPAGASGSYWTCLFVESLPAPAAGAEAGETLSVGLRLGSYVYVSVGKIEKPSAELGLTVSTTEGGGYTARAELSHTAGGVLRLQGQWRLLGPKGDVLSKEEQTEVALLPGTKRILSWKSENPGSLPAASRIELRFEGSGLSLRRDAPLPSGIPRSPSP